eukprot:TRINITY_DN482_c0_g1_i5.p1 TRINITY_DN482_c0_g1~~TRINITY_DN482_c0_g1_i5.p1  ORF type:complete len:239 (-),score=45.32 TRINITY_DN482_c0_g1_i5:256-972(-)
MAICIGNAIVKTQAVTMAAAMAAGTTAASSSAQLHGKMSSCAFPSGLGRVTALRIADQKVAPRSRPLTICMAEGDDASKPSTSEGVSSEGTSPLSSPATAPVAKPPTPKRRPEGFGDMMAFSGPAPELINGRLAMVGFVAGLVAERMSGLTFVEQFESAQFPIVGVAVVFALASFIPKFVSGSPLGDLLKNANKDKSTSGVLKPFNADVERLNGRLAMLGFAAILIIEASNGSGIFTA